MHFQHFWGWPSSDINQKRLISYFRSGWAFLIPYLAVYLLYAWLKWPVNPVAAGSSSVGGGQWTVVPCLLHVYWTLHAIHLVMGAIALRTWWIGSGVPVTGATDNSEKTANRATPSQPSTVNRSPSTVPLRGNRPPLAMDRLWPAMPWLLLALLFYIPGVYLEYPADTWEHLARINEWGFASHIFDHSAWNKFSYFFAYSLRLPTNTPSAHKLFLNIYISFVCLLLCWQYYRLAYSLGFSACTALIFVIIQSLLFGNNLFSFYRYYGLSSTIFSQIGAIALVRITLNTAEWVIANDHNKLQKVVAAYLFGALPLMAMIYLNHSQSFAVAAAGVTAVVLWSSIAKWRAARYWILLGLLALNLAAFLFMPRDPLLDSNYRANGWLTSYYGFNLLSTIPGGAGARSIDILGILGLVNLALGFLLVGYKNSIVGWITIIPVLGLTMPVVAIPLANALAHYEINSIITFHRVLFGVPAGLALVEFTSLTWRVLRIQYPKLEHFPASISLIIGLAIFQIMPLRTPFSNRLWNCFSIVPNDLQLTHLVHETEVIRSIPDNSRLIAMEGIVFPAFALGDRKNNSYLGGRLILPDYSPAKHASKLFSQITDLTTWRQSSILLLSTKRNLYSSVSFSGLVSGHWMPNQVAIDSIATQELENAARNLGWKPYPSGSVLFYQLAIP